MHIHTQPTYPLARIGGHTPFMGQKKRCGTRDSMALFFIINKKNSGGLIPPLPPMRR